jgi:hypothetical protein
MAHVISAFRTSLPLHRTAGVAQHHAASAPCAAARLISEGVTSETPIAVAETVIDATILAGRNLPYPCGGGI